MSKKSYNKLNCTRLKHPRITLTSIYMVYPSWTCHSSFLCRWGLRQL